MNVVNEVIEELFREDDGDLTVAEVTVGGIVGLMAMAVEGVQEYERQKEEQRKF